MKVFIDDEDNGRPVLNGVTVVMDHEGKERHVRITEEGVVIDMVQAGFVASTAFLLFCDIDPHED